VVTARVKKIGKIYLIGLRKSRAAFYAALQKE